MARPREILSLDDLKSRLLARIAIREDGCWMWLGAWSDSGYGAMHYEGKQLSAHVASYMTHIGPVPSELWVLHTCDNKWCVNPDHLFLGTVQDNVDDAISKKRHAYGERQGHSKLKEGEVIRIYELLEQGIPLTEIGRLYKVTPEAIGLINRGKNWRYLFEERYL